MTTPDHIRSSNRSRRDHQYPSFCLNGEGLESLRISDGTGGGISETAPRHVFRCLLDREPPGRISELWRRGRWRRSELWEAGALCVCVCVGFFRKKGFGREVKKGICLTLLCGIKWNYVGKSVWQCNFLFPGGVAFYCY